MSWAFAVAGWALAACLLAVLRRRLALVADAEHELRGAAAAIGLAAERMKRAGATRAFASLLDVQLDRAKAGLADLERARRRPRRRTAGATDAAHRFGAPGPGGDEPRDERGPARNRPG